MHVFVSYKHEDYDFAENVINKLEKAGFQTWADDQIRAGEEWRTVIDLSIKNSFALIVIMTPEAKASEYVTYEWAFALGNGVRVIPVMLKTTVLHPRLEALQYLGFTNRTGRQWEQLLEEVRAAQKTPLAHTILIPLNASPFIRQAVAALDSASSAERAEAIATLAQSQGHQAQEVLLEALQHPIKDVQLGAALALWAQGNDSGKRILVETLQDGTSRQRLQILSTLEQSIDALDVSALLSALQDPDGAVHQLTVKALASISDPITLSAWVKILQDPDPSLRPFAAKALGNIGDNNAIPALLEVFSQKPYTETHVAAVEALGKLGNPAVIPTLSKILQDSQSHYDPRLPNLVERIAETVIGALGKLGDTTVISLLLKWGLRLPQSVTAALLMILGPSIADTLLDFLKDPDFVIRLSTVQILGAICTSNPTVPLALAEALEDDPDPTVRQSIAETLEKIADASAIPALAKAFQQNNQPHETTIRLSLIKALGKMGDANIVPTLLEALRDPDPSVCSQAATLLKGMGDASVIPILQQFLSRDEYKQARLFIIQILADIGDMSVKPSLYSISLNDLDPQARFQAKWALEKIVKRNTLAPDVSY